MLKMTYRTDMENTFDLVDEVAGLDKHGKRMALYSPQKTRVVFAYPSAGYRSHQETAAKHLEVGKAYTVESTKVGGWHTDVYLEEFPGVAFNSVMFVEESDYVSNPSSSSDSAE
jgi:hypothetical protein